jgi:hypothetical protein
MARATKFRGDVAVTGSLTVGGAEIINGTVSDAITFEDEVTLEDVLALSAAGFTMSAIARTATADGTGTGAIASGPMLQFISVTSANANNIVTLPAPVPGLIVILHVGATGFELRTSAPATIAINGGSGANAESAIGANVTAILICASATSWKGLQLGADGTLAQVEAAA